MASAARVYVRSTDEEKYREVIPSVPPQEFWSAVVCDASPLVFFAVRESPKEGLILYQAQLPLPVLERLPSPTLDGSHARFWLAALHAAACDGTNVLVSVAVQPQPAADGSYSVGYVLARMAVSSGALSIVADLPAIFA